MPAATLHSVRNSAIHGRGLYAKKNIAKDTWILQYVGEKVDKDESDRRATALLEKAAKDNSAKVYTFILSDKWDIDGDVPWNPARLMNHSCQPNVEAQNWKDKEIWFIALRDIKRGEELTFNYGFDLECWEDHPCRCGNENCVGYIAGEEYWPKLKKKIVAKEARLKKQKEAKASKKKTAKKTATTKTSKVTKKAVKSTKKATVKKTTKKAAK